MAVLTKVRRGLLAAGGVSTPADDDNNNNNMAGPLSPASATAVVSRPRSASPNRLPISPSPLTHNNSAHARAASSSSKAVCSDVPLASTSSTSSSNGRVQLSIVCDAHTHVAGQRVQGVLEVDVRSDRVAIGELGMEWSGYEELMSQDHTSTKTLLNAQATFQSPRLRRPSALVDPSFVASPSDTFMPARAGVTRFPFSFKIPVGAPSSCVLGANARVRYELRAFATCMLIPPHVPLSREIAASRHVQGQPTTRPTYDPDATDPVCRGPLRGELAVTSANKPVAVVERWDDWDLPRYREAVERSAVSEGERTRDGKVELAARISHKVQGEQGGGRLYWRTQPGIRGSNSAIEIAISVRNNTKKPLQGIKLSLCRRLVILTPKGAPKPPSRLAPMITSIVQADVRRGDQFDFLPSGTPGRDDAQRSHEATAIIDVPRLDECWSVRGGRLFELECVVRVEPEHGASPGLVVDLPIWIAHPLSLPSSAYAFYALRNPPAPAPALHWHQHQQHAPHGAEFGYGHPHMHPHHQQQYAYQTHSSAASSAGWAAPPPPPPPPAGLPTSYTSPHLPLMASPTPSMPTPIMYPPSATPSLSSHASSAALVAPPPPPPPPPPPAASVPPYHNQQYVAFDPNASTWTASRLYDAINGAATPEQHSHHAAHVEVSQAQAPPPRPPPLESVPSMQHSEHCDRADVHGMPSSSSAPSTPASRRTLPRLPSRDGSALGAGEKRHSRAGTSESILPPPPPLPTKLGAASEQRTPVEAPPRRSIGSSAPDDSALTPTSSRLTRTAAAPVVVGGGHAQEASETPTERPSPHVEPALLSPKPGRSAARRRYSDAEQLEELVREQEEQRVTRGMASLAVANDDDDDALARTPSVASAASSTRRQVGGGGLDVLEALLVSRASSVSSQARPPSATSSPRAAGAAPRESKDSARLFYRHPGAGEGALRAKSISRARSVMAMSSFADPSSADAAFESPAPAPARLDKSEMDSASRLAASRSRTTSVPAGLSNALRDYERARAAAQLEGNATAPVRASQETRAQQSVAQPQPAGDHSGRHLSATQHDELKSQAARRTADWIQQSNSSSDLQSLVPARQAPAPPPAQAERTPVAVKRSSAATLTRSASNTGAWAAMLSAPATGDRQRQVDSRQRARTRTPSPSTVKNENTPPATHVPVQLPARTPPPSSAALSSRRSSTAQPSPASRGSPVKLEQQSPATKRMSAAPTRHDVTSPPRPASGAPTARRQNGLVAEAAKSWAGKFQQEPTSSPTPKSRPHSYAAPAASTPEEDSPKGVQGPRQPAVPGAKGRTQRPVSAMPAQTFLNTNASRLGMMSGQQQQPKTLQDLIKAYSGPTR